MLHIAFAELTRCGAEQMLAGQGRFGMHQGHHVLQLVAESVGAAGLIKPGSAPEPATQGLIQEPAVCHHVDGGIGRIDVDRAEGPTPILPDAFQRRAAGAGPAEAPDQILHISRIEANPEAEARFPFLSLRQIESHLHRGARIKTSADLAGQARALQRRRLGQTAVSANKLLAISGKSASRIVYVNEHQAIGEFGVVIIARQQYAGLKVHLGLHVQQVLMPQVAHHQLPVSRDRDAARTS